MPTPAGPPDGPARCKPAPVLPLRDDDQPRAPHPQRQPRPHTGLGPVADASAGHRRARRDRGRGGTTGDPGERLGGPGPSRRGVGRGHRPRLPRRVATGEVSPAAPVGDLASYPVIGIGEDFSQAAAFSRMIDRGVHHLVVLDAPRRPWGIMRAVDFASAEIRNPLQVRSLIDDAETVEAVRAAAQLVLPSLVELGHSGCRPSRSATCTPRSSMPCCASWSACTGSTKLALSALVGGARLDGAARAAAPLRRRHRDGLGRSRRRRGPRGLPRPGGGTAG